MWKTKFIYVLQINILFYAIISMWTTTHLKVCGFTADYYIKKQANIR